MNCGLRRPAVMPSLEQRPPASAPSVCCRPTTHHTIPPIPNHTMTTIPQHTRSYHGRTHPQHLPAIPIPLLVCDPTLEKRGETAAEGKTLSSLPLDLDLQDSLFNEKRNSSQQSKLTKKVSLHIISSAVLSCWQPQPLPFANELRPHCQAVNTTGTAPASCPDGLHSFFSRGMRSRLVGGRKAGGTEP